MSEVKLTIGDEVVYATGFMSYRKSRAYGFVKLKAEKEEATPLAEAEGGLVSLEMAYETLEPGEKVTASSEGKTFEVRAVSWNDIDFS